MTAPSQQLDALAEFGEDVMLSGPFVFSCITVLALAYALRCCGLTAKVTTLLSLAVAVALVFLQFETQDMPPSFPYPWLAMVCTGIIIWSVDLVVHGAILSRFLTISPFQKSGDTQVTAKKK